MTQFQPPPPPMAGYSDYRPPAPPPWSAAAIAAFISSLLGFLGITALLGLVLGIVGIISTKDGRKRGFGLAVASIPISLFMAAVFALCVVLVVMFAQMAKIPDLVKGTMALEAGDMSAAASSLRELSTPELNAAVTPEQMHAWLSKVRAEHGKLTSLQLRNTGQVASVPTPGGMRLDLDGKFVNGPANVGITLNAANPFKMKIDNIEVGKSSLRDAAQAAP